MKRINFLIFALCLLFAFGINSSCTEEEALDPPRLFKPVLKTAQVVQNTLGVRWEQSKSAKGYKLEVSLTETFNADSLVHTAIIDKDSVIYWVKELEEQTMHYYRLTALNLDEKYNSKPSKGSAVTGKAPSLFQISSQDIGFTEIDLRWMDAEGIDLVDNIQAINISDPNDVINYILSSQEVQQRAAKLTGLKPGQLYYIKLRQGTVVRTSAKVRTISQPAGLVIIEPWENMKSIIEGGAAGSFFMLRGDTVYNVNDFINITKTVTIMGEPGKSKPKVYVTSFRIGGDILVDIEIDSIRINGIEVSGYKLDVDGNEMTSSNPNFRFFNFDPPAGKLVTIGKISVEDVYMRNYMYAAFHVRTPKLHLGELYINNCVAYDMNRNAGGYSFIGLAANNSSDVSCNKFTISNSTFVNVWQGLIEMRKFTGTGTNPDIHKIVSVNVINCTFDRFGVKNMTPGITWGGGNPSARQFFKFDSYASVPVNISNCVFGEMSTTANSLSAAPQTQSILTLANTVQSTDCMVLFNATSSGTPVLQLFPGRDNFNYIIPSGFGYTDVGDPRWK